MLEPNFRLPSITSRIVVINLWEETVRTVRLTCAFRTLSPPTGFQVQSQRTLFTAHHVPLTCRQNVQNGRKIQRCDKTQLKNWMRDRNFLSSYTENAWYYCYFVSYCGITICNSFNIYWRVWGNHICINLLLFIINPTGVGQNYSNTCPHEHWFTLTAFLLFFFIKHVSKKLNYYADIIKNSRVVVKLLNHDTTKWCLIINLL